MPVVFNENSFRQGVRQGLGSSHATNAIIRPWQMPEAVSQPKDVTS